MMHLSKLKKYPPIVNYQDLLKVLGIVLITLDHVSTFIVYVPIFSVLGNAGAPLFFFVAGMHTPKRIHWEYLAVGAFLTFVTYLSKGYWFGNILISFFIIKLVLYQFPKWFNGFWGGVSALIPMLVQPLNLLYLNNTFFEFGGFGVSYGFSAQVRKHHRLWGTVLCLMVLSGHYVWMHFIPRSAFTLPFDPQSFSFSLTNVMDYLAVGLFYLVYLCMSFIFISFKPQNYSIEGREKWVILVVSRYSLHIYAAQLLLFHLLFNL